MTKEPDTSKDAALRAVGRTVVNFQRLEYNLKVAARLGHLNGTAQKIQHDQAKRNERAASLTLGQAIQAWLKYCGDTPAYVSSTADLFDVSFQTTFSLELDAALHERHAMALKNLLEIRNVLIHSRLAKFDWESPQKCRELAEELHTVNSAISEQLEYTSSLLAATSDLLREHASAIAAEFGLTVPPLTCAMPSTSLERTRGE
jgi:hypothetical protein